MSIYLPGREAESIKPLETAKEFRSYSDKQLLNTQQCLGASVGVLQYRPNCSGPMSTWEIFSITTTEKQSNNKTPPWTASWLWRDGWMNELSSNWTFLSAVNMCFLGDRKQIPSAEVVQLIWLYRKWNLYQTLKETLSCWERQFYNRRRNHTEL